jgi:hypothetical protein
MKSLFKHGKPLNLQSDKGIELLKYGGPTVPKNEGFHTTHNSDTKGLKI